MTGWLQRTKGTSQAPYPVPCWRWGPATASAHTSDRQVTPAGASPSARTWLPDQERGGARVFSYGCLAPTKYRYIPLPWPVCRLALFLTPYFVVPTKPPSPITADDGKQCCLHSRGLVDLSLLATGRDGVFPLSTDSRDAATTTTTTASSSDHGEHALGSLLAWTPAPCKEGKEGERGRAD